jgi:hypothetical protein
MLRGKRVYYIWSISALLLYAGSTICYHLYTSAYARVLGAVLHEGMDPSQARQYWGIFGSFRVIAACLAIGAVVCAFLALWKAMRILSTVAFILALWRCFVLIMGHP